jgi:Mu transposase, C-terminal domain
LLSREDVVEIVALRGRGWSVSAIARHTGRDRKTIRAWLAQGERRRRPRAPSVLESFRGYVERRFADDPHLDATVLLRELRPLGFDRSYQTLTRELRRLALRPECPVCKRGGHRLTIELAHEPGEELQLDWLELAETPWGAPCCVLVVRSRTPAASAPPSATASTSRTSSLRSMACRAGKALRGDGCRPSAAARTAQGRRRGEHPLPRPLLVAHRAGRDIGGGAQRSLDAWCVEVADQRRRGPLTVAQNAAGEPLLPLPPTAYPAELRVERVVSASALVSFEDNRYSVQPTLAGQTVTVRVRVGEPTLQIVSATGVLIATHRRAPAGAGQLVRSQTHQEALERAVLAAFTTRPRCASKPNRPPSAEALALAGAHTAASDVAIPSLADYARLAAVSCRATRRGARAGGEDEAVIHALPQAAARGRGRGDRTAPARRPIALRQLPHPEDARRHRLRRPARARPQARRQARRRARHPSASSKSAATCC